MTISIDGSELQGITIDGTQVQEITIDGVTVYTTSQVVDDFEDDDISEYGGHTGNFSVTTGTVKSGSHALQMNTNGNNHQISDTNDLTHPSLGDTFEAWIYFQGGRPAFSWFTQTETHDANGYGARIQGSSFKIQRNPGGGNTSTLESANVSPSNGWYRIEITHASDNTITATLENSTGTQLAQISASDSTYESGGVGWVMNSGGYSETAYGDGYKIL